jgi:hypothetical protein
MGIAIGSKYNALIALFIISMMLMLRYVRDTNKQIKAFQYGILFFGIAILVTSPWYLKNYLQTGNPLYPLFNRFFQSLHHGPVQEVLYRQVIQKTGQINFFKMREVMYGETFWETLLIPIRMFFQGEDNSYRYFQGALNPILIVFSPFILLGKRHVKDKLLFVSFSVLFVTMAYFLTAKQVRYILPVLPFLTILAVMGIKDLLDNLKERKFFSFSQSGKNLTSIAKIIIFSIISVLLVFNLLYLKNRISAIKPFGYVLGRETKKSFLRRHLLHYQAVEYINQNLPDDAKVFTMFLGRRGYYLERDYRNEPSFGIHTINQMIKRSSNEKVFKKYIRSMNCTHILMRTSLVDNYLNNNFSSKEIEIFKNLTKKYWKIVYKYNGYSVWDIRNCLQG